MANMWLKITLMLLAAVPRIVKSAWDDAGSLEALPSPFRIVIDGGSTGSRLHIYEFVRDGPSTETECVRRGSTKAHVPMSGFGRPPSRSHVPLNSTHVAEHLLPLFEYASDVIPAKYHASTPVTYQATAGMRLLDEAEQVAVYDALYDGLRMSDRFVFANMSRDDVGTLGGDREAFYGAVAANYLKGLVDVDLRMKADDAAAAAGRERSRGDDDRHDGPLGALDMGGASAQIVFLPKAMGGSTCSPSDSPRGDRPSDGADADTCANAEGAAAAASARLDGSDFFSTSYLAYGVDQFRERLWDTLVNDAMREAYDSGTCSSSGGRVVSNPCAFVGYAREWRGFTLVGTGDAQVCAAHVRRLIPHRDSVHEGDEPLRGRVGGIEHPPLRGKFFAMSLFFFTLDSLRELSRARPDAHERLNLSWPNPSIEELSDALEGLCSRSWQGDLEDIQHNSHEFTRAEVLPHRCIESVYLVTLLRDGFGFVPSSRDITFLYLMDGSEVEWSLGMALVQYAGEEERPASTTDTTGQNTEPDEDANMDNDLFSSYAPQRASEDSLDDTNKTMESSSTSPADPWSWSLHRSVALLIQEGILALSAKSLVQSR